MISRHRSMLTTVTLGALACLSGSLQARGDDVYLTNGGVFEGVVAELSETHVSVELPYGRLKLPRSRVERVVKAESPLETFRQRRSELLLDPTSSAESWLELAQWASINELEHDARDTALLVARLDPDIEGLPPLLSAHGFVRDESLGWVSLERSMARQGLVRHRGEWLRPRERQELIDAENERLAAARVEAERGSASGSSTGASSEDVALEAVRLARDVVRGDTGRGAGRASSPRFGQVVGIGGFFAAGAPIVLPALPLSGSFEQEVSGGAEKAKAAPALRRARVRSDWDVIANRQPGSFIPLQAQRRQVPRR